MNASMPGPFVFQVIRISGMSVHVLKYIRISTGWG